MTTVIQYSRPRAGVNVQTPALSRNSSLGAMPAAAMTDVQRHAAIENALSMALYFMRQPGNMAANLWAATARTNRALSLLKQASEGASSKTVEG